MGCHRFELKLNQFLAAIINCKSAKSFSFLTKLRCCFLYLCDATLSTEYTVVETFSYELNKFQLNWIKKSELFSLNAMNCFAVIKNFLFLICIMSFITWTTWLKKLKNLRTLWRTFEAENAPKIRTSRLGKKKRGAYKKSVFSEPLICQADLFFITRSIQHIRGS